MHACCHSLNVLIVSPGKVRREQLTGGVTGYCLQTFIFHVSIRSTDKSTLSNNTLNNIQKMSAIDSSYTERVLISF